jgi:leader peptidase (prepilin peptidase) / N-methyltransferase
MNLSYTLHVLWIHWPWWLAGALVGLWLVPLARIIPRKVLQFAQAPQHEWQGPGGGLEHPIPLARRIWVPMVNASLWVYAASTDSHPAFWGALLWASLASTLVLLALIDWDTTMLPDLLVLPLGMAGLASSSAGFTPHSLLVSAISATVVLGLLGGLAWVFQRIKGESGIGGGDLKLLAALATWWGVLGVLYVVLWASVFTVVWHFVWRRFKGLSPQAEWPFGPAIVVAALVWGFWVAYSPTPIDSDAYRGRRRSAQPTVPEHVCNPKVMFSHPTPCVTFQETPTPEIRHL